MEEVFEANQTKELYNRIASITNWRSPANANKSFLTMSQFCAEMEKSAKKYKKLYEMAKIQLEK